MSSNPLKRLETMFNSLGVILPNNIKRSIEHNLEFNKYINKHFAFILDLKTLKVLCYDSNVYFVSDTFPFSVHAEVQTIVRYYKTRSVAKNKNKKAVIVVKMSRTGIIGNSKCCLNCMRFIRNNIDNLNIKKIHYSTIGNNLIELTQKDLIDENFRSSKGFNHRQFVRDPPTTK